MEIEQVLQNFTRRGLKALYFETAAEAADYVADRIHGKTVGIGGSKTIDTMGLYERLQMDNTVYWHWKQGPEARDTATKTQVYLTGANALSEELSCDPLATHSSTFDAPQNSVVAKFATTAADGKIYAVEHYSLDVILSVGYRVKSPQGVLFRRWANAVLRDYLLRGYAVNTRLNQLEDKMDRRLAQTEADVIELKEKVDFFVQTKEPPLQGVFYDGQLWDARALVLSLVSRAKRALILIDNWATPETLDLFTKKHKGVKVTIFTSEHFKKGAPHHSISDADIETFNAQYPKLAVRYTEKFHDRFLVVDDKELYLIGASLKDLGRKCFAFTKLDATAIRAIKRSAFL